MAVSSRANLSSISPPETTHWGPDVIQHNGILYCFYSASTFGTQTSTVGIAMSETLKAGPWPDHEQVIPSSADAGIVPYNIMDVIDLAVFLDPTDGTACLNYSSFFGNLGQLVIAPDFLLVPSATSAVQVSINPVIPPTGEGSSMSYHDGWYYLWFSHGICGGFNAGDLPPNGQEYSICVSRSQIARDPFIDMG